MGLTKEFIQDIAIAAGAKFGKATFTPEAGRIVGCIIYTNGATTTGFVRAMIKNSAGAEISALQDLRNYRSREGEYLKSCKPFRDNGGKPLTLEIIAENNFAADFAAELVLIYEQGEF
jgi:hypothetical protein